MDNPGDAKYGMTTEQLFEAYRILKEKGVEEFGLHAFLASNTVTNDYYPTLAKTLFEVAVRLKKETGANIRFINLSGGIGIPYKPDQEPNDIFKIGEGVKAVYDEVLVPAGMGDVAIYTELGRFMMGPYGALVTRAINEKHTHKEYIGVDACAVNLMRPAMYGAYHHITVMGKEDAPCDHKYDVTGSLCENNDKFAIDRMLPEIKRGDLLYIHDTGAHGFAMGYNYNGKLKSAEILLKPDGSFQLIRRAETPADYFRTFDCFDFYKKCFPNKERSYLLWRLPIYICIRNTVFWTAPAGWIIFVLPQKNWGKHRLRLPTTAICSVRWIFTRLLKHMELNRLSAVKFMSQNAGLLIKSTDLIPRVTTLFCFAKMKPAIKI